MGKLMKSILSSLLYASVKSQSATTSAYQVTDCNNDATQRPELTFKIAQDFFSNNLSGHEGDYELRDGYYHRIIEESELTLGFGTNANGDGVILLSFTVDLASNGFDLNSNAGVSFGQDSLQFQCQYLRQINVVDSYDVNAVQTEPIVGTGIIAYEMVVDIPSSGVGRTTTVTISPLHNLSVAAVLTECTVTHIDSTGSSHFLHPVHKFKDDTVCFDNSRLMFEQTQFTPDVEFTMRTFRFVIDGEDSSIAQPQTISCRLQLDPIANLLQEQADNCDCYTQTQCQTPAVPACQNPQTYNLPADFTYADQIWGNVFYKVLGQMDYASGKAACESIGSTLAMPNSDAENIFIQSLAPGENIWLGMELQGYTDDYPSTEANWNSFDQQWRNGDNHSWLKTADNQPLRYSNWKTRHPSRNGGGRAFIQPSEDVQRHYTGYQYGWMPADGTQSYTAICYHVIPDTATWEYFHHTVAVGNDVTRREHGSTPIATLTEALEYCDTLGSENCQQIHQCYQWMFKVYESGTGHRYPFQAPDNFTPRLEPFRVCGLWVRRSDRQTTCADNSN